MFWKAIAIALALATPAFAQGDPMDALRRGLGSSPSSSPAAAPQMPPATTQAPAAPLTPQTGFDASPFVERRTLTLLYNGDFDTLRTGQVEQVVHYLIEMNNYFSSQSCAAYTDPGVDASVNRSIVEWTASPNAPAQVLDALTQLMRNPGAVMGQVAMRERAQQAGQVDAAQLSGIYGCEHETFRRLYANLASFLRNNDPAFASGWPGVRLECVKRASKMGAAANESRKSCGCIVEQFARSGAPSDVAEWLRVNYDHGANFASVVQKNEGLRKQIAACLL